MYGSGLGGYGGYGMNGSVVMFIVVMAGVIFLNYRLVFLSTYKIILSCSIGMVAWAASVACTGVEWATEWVSCVFILERLVN